MAIPKFFEFFRPMLSILRDVESMQVKDMCPLFVKCFNLNAEEVAQLTPRGMKPTYKDRIDWSVQYLKNAGLIERVSRGTYRITEIGKQAVASDAVIDVAYLNQFDSFKKYHTVSTTPKDGSSSPNPVAISETTPIESIETAYTIIHKELSKNLLATIMDSSPDFFEKLVVDLLLAMGYGYDSEGAGMVTGKTGDEGIDGIINEDKLGFSQVYVQAKRWSDTHPVGGPDVHSFIGAIVSKGANKGLFITTSRFTEAAKKAASETKAIKLVLVDGVELTRLMIAHGVGVSAEHVYTIMRIDNDYFEE